MQPRASPAEPPTPWASKISVAVTGCGSWLSPFHVISVRIVVRLYVVVNKRSNGGLILSCLPRSGRAQFQHNHRVNRYKDATGGHAKAPPVDQRASSNEEIGNSDPDARAIGGYPHGAHSHSSSKSLERQRRIDQTIPRTINSIPKKAELATRPTPSQPAQPLRRMRQDR